MRNCAMPLDAKEYEYGVVFLNWRVLLLLADSRVYRTPLVLGTSLVPVLSIAVFNATANALKALSALREKVDVEHFIIR